MPAAAPWWAALSLAAAVALVAWRAGSLRGDGAVAAWITGALALRTGWHWGAYLITWFVLASVLSRMGKARKSARVGAVVAKGDRRDAWQVMANGGVFACCAAWSLWRGVDAMDPWTAVAAAASLAAAGADTWATEIGTWIGGTPWSLRERRRVPVGTSGAITLSGTLGGVAGGVLLAALASALGIIAGREFLAVAVGSSIGALADTVVGAWWQERRHCPRCAMATERRVHDCGTNTTVAGGIAGLDNDVVNLLCTLAGAGTALLFAAASG